MAGGLIRVVGAVLLGTLLLAGCGDDSDDGDEPGASQASTTSSTSSGETADPSSTTTAGDAPAAACGRGPQNARVSARGDQWVLSAQVQGEPVERELLVEDRTAEPRVLGSHDVDGDGAVELFLEMGRGASATAISLITVTDECELATVQLPDGFIAQFPVGASAATQDGLACRDDQLMELHGETDDGRTYRWTSRTLSLDGATLAEVGGDNGTYTSPEDDDKIRRLGTLDCGAVSL